MPMTVPNNVLRFQVLLYMSLMLDAVSVAFHDRAPTDEMTDSMILASTVLAFGEILLLFYFVHLAARQRLQDQQVKRSRQQFQRLWLSHRLSMEVCA